MRMSVGRPISSDNTNDKDDPVNPIGPFQFATYDSANVVSTEEQHLLQPQDTAQQHLKSFLLNREKAAAAGVAGATMMAGIEPKDHFYLYICRWVLCLTMLRPVLGTCHIPSYEGSMGWVLY